jgi:hypothetical protein
MRDEVPLPEGVGGEPRRSGFLANLVSVFLSPGRVFDQISHDLAPWWHAFLLVSVLQILSQALVMPGAVAVLENNPPPELTAEQVENQIEMTRKFGAVGLLAIPLTVAAFTAVAAGLMLLLSKIVSDRGTFRRMFSLFLYTGYVGVLGQLLGGLVVRARGFEDIMSRQDLSVVFGLPLLVGDVESAPLSALLDMTGIFGIWGLVLLVLGLSTILGISRRQGFYLLVPLILIEYALRLVGGLLT